MSISWLSERLIILRKLRVVLQLTLLRSAIVIVLGKSIVLCSTYFSRVALYKQALVPDTLSKSLESTLTTVCVYYRVINMDWLCSWQIMLGSFLSIIELIYILMSLQSLFLNSNPKFSTIIYPVWNRNNSYLWITLYLIKWFGTGNAHLKCLNQQCKHSQMTIKNGLLVYQMGPFAVTQHFFNVF